MNLRYKMRAISSVRRWLALGAVTLLSAAAAHGQNLDQGKSGARLYAESCAACHRSARGLAKGRFRLTLYLFLQQHYASNSGSAWALASYLESIDSKPRGSAPKHSAPRAPKSGSSLRPPASIPQR